MNLPDRKQVKDIFEGLLQLDGIGGCIEVHIQHEVIRLHEERAERPGVVVRELAEHQPAFLLLQLLQARGELRVELRGDPLAVRGVALVGHRVTVTFSRAERRAASSTSRAAAASRAVTGFGAPSSRAFATAA